MKCPNCGSEHVHFASTTETQGLSLADSCCGMILLGPIGILCGACGMGSHTKQFWICSDCGNKFSVREGQKSMEDEQQKQILFERYREELDLIPITADNRSEIELRRQESVTEYAEAEKNLRSALIALTGCPDSNIQWKARLLRERALSGLSKVVFGLGIALSVIGWVSQTIPLLIVGLCITAFGALFKFSCGSLEARLMNELEAARPEYKTAAENERKARVKRDYYATLVKQADFEDSNNKGDGTP